MAWITQDFHGTDTFDTFPINLDNLCTFILDKKGIVFYFVSGISRRWDFINKETAELEYNRIIALIQTP
jgi:hypothetical protein